MSMELRERILTYFKETSSKPLSVEEIEEVFEVEGSEQFKELVVLLNELEEAGELVRTRKNRFGYPERMNLIRGKIQMHKKGFAFLIPDEEGRKDVYLHHTDLGNAMHGDKVLVRLEKPDIGDNRPEGTVVRILERSIDEVVGTYDEGSSFGFVIADNQRIANDIFVPNGKSLGAASGHKVIVKITKYPEGRKSAEGEVISILGHKNDPGIDILSIIHRYGMSNQFPEEVLEQAAETGEKITAEDLAGRRDLRDQTVVTIDGADAKDLDDAVSVKVLENGNYRLGVYIADVSHYVTKGSPMDKEAYERGTSVYLVDRVIPMIPHRLSNGICSLNPHEDRLAMGCEMEIDSRGKVVKHELFECVINSKQRMTYHDVNQILVEQDAALREKYAEFVPMFGQMEQLAAVLRNKRMDRGAIDFDFKEAKVLVDPEGKPTDIVLRERSVAERLIEEFMLAANETVSEHMHWLDVPFIHRIHEDPDQGKLQSFFEFLNTLGYRIKGTANEIHPQELQKVLERVEGKPEEMVVSKLMLRSMKQAKYAEENVGHFGLATEFYTHFTSPIRRYPDLIVHRLIRNYILQQKLDEETITSWKEKLPEIARHTSEKERNAVEAEREVDDLKKAEFMADKVGEVFTGIISSVTNFGIFVELPNTVEGLVHISYMLDDYYHFNEKNMALIGERTKNIYRIGDEIKVQVARVNLDERAIDFAIVQGQTTKKAKTNGKLNDKKTNTKRKSNENKTKAKRNKKKKK